VFDALNLKSIGLNIDVLGNRTELKYRLCNEISRLYDGRLGTFLNTINGGFKIGSALQQVK
jgi:hypothetical protein